MSNAVKTLRALCRASHLQEVVEAWCREQRLHLNYAALERVHVSRAGGILVSVMCCTSDRGEYRLWLEVSADPAGRARDLIRSLMKRKRRQLQDHQANCICGLTLYGVVVMPQGLDARLPGLHLLCQPEQRARLSERVLDRPARSNGDVHGAQLLAHRLGKRAVLRVVAGQGRSFIVKAYRQHSDKPGVVSQRMKTLIDQGLTLAEPILVDADLTAIVMEDVAGTSLLEVLPRAQRRVLEETGGLLRRLHQSEVPGLPVYDVAEELNLLARWITLIEQIDPDYGRRLWRAHTEVVRGLTKHGEQDVRERVACHRDFHEQQVLFDGEQAWLLDLDTMALADPALDLGNYLAHLDLFNLAQAHGAKLDEGHFIGAYEQGGALRMSAVAAWRNATLLRLACIHFFSAARRIRTEALLEACCG